MTSEYLRQLLDFHYWARDRVFARSSQLTAEHYARADGKQLSIDSRHAQPRLSR